MYISNDSTNCHFILKKKYVGTMIKAHILSKLQWFLIPSNSEIIFISKTLSWKVLLPNTDSMISYVDWKFMVRCLEKKVTCWSLFVRIFLKPKWKIQYLNSNCVKLRDVLGGYTDHQYQTETKIRTFSMTIALK